MVAWESFDFTATIPVTNFSLFSQFVDSVGKFAEQSITLPISFNRFLSLSARFINRPFFPRIYSAEVGHLCSWCDIYIFSKRHQQEAASLAPGLDCVCSEF